MYIFVHLLVLLMHLSLLREFWSMNIFMTMLVTRLCWWCHYHHVTNLYLIRAFSVTILWVAASFSLEKNKSGFQICFRTSECTVSTSICVSLIVSFRPFWLFQKRFFKCSATLRFMWTIWMKCTVIKTRQVYCKKRYDFECGNIGRIIIQPRMVNQVY